MKTIFGIDPGLASTGYGLVQVRGQTAAHLAHGVIVTQAKAGIPARLEEIYRNIRLLIAQYQPDEAAIEEIYFSKNSKTFTGVAQAKGVIILAFAQAGVPVIEYSPLEIKLAVAGNGRAEKAQVQELVRIILKLKDQPSPDHAADALATAICHSHQSLLNDLIGRSGRKNV